VVFITTSRFTAGAREDAERINARIELIDGNRLAWVVSAVGSRGPTGTGGDAVTGWKRTTSKPL
jgi:hypothetical protein